MRRLGLVTAAVVGALVGALGLWAWIFFGPAGQRSETAPITQAGAEGELLESFFIDITKHAIAATHNGQQPLAAFPPGIGTLAEPALERSLAFLMKLSDASGRVVGFASELEVMSPDSSLVSGKMVLATDWTLVLPGRGSIFLAQVEDASDFIKRVALPVIASRKDWEGDWKVVSTIGPRADGRGVIVGGSGEFEGVTGSFVEREHLTKFTTDMQMTLTVELQLAYRKP